MPHRESTPETGFAILDSESRAALISRVMWGGIPVLIGLSLTGIYMNTMQATHPIRLLLNLSAFFILSGGLLCLIWGRLLMSIQVLIYGSLFIFSLATILNGGVKVPNYSGFFALFALAR